MLCKKKPYNGVKPYIFFSYCHEDADRVYPIIEDLICAGYRIWYDEGINSDADGIEVIAGKLSDSAVCIAAISSKSTQSHSCRNEIAFIIQNNKHLISLQLEEFILPLGISLQLASTQMIKVYEYPKDELLSKICCCEALNVCLRDEIESEETQWNAWEISDFEPDETILHQDDEAIARIRAEEETQWNAWGISDFEPDETILHQEDEAIARIRAEEETQWNAWEISDFEPDETILHQEDEATVLNLYGSNEYSGNTIIEEVANVPVFIRLNTNELFLGKYPLTSIGRSRSECDIYFETVKTMTSHHVDVIIHNNHHFIIDRNSANGTYINGERLDKGERAEIQYYAEVNLSRSEPFFIAFDKYAKWIKENMCLICLISLETREKLYLFDNETILGRSFPWASGAMTSKMIGRQHAIISYVNNQCYLTDQSHNGSYVNDKKIESYKAVLLKDGDRICLGKENFVFRYSVLKEGIIV